jgi:hypothetical protein
MIVLNPMTKASDTYVCIDIHAVATVMFIWGMRASTD